MVRKSLSETLNAEAKRFLEEGRPKPSNEPKRKPDPKKWIGQQASSGIDRLVSAAFWNEDDRDALKDLFLQRYVAHLEETGQKVTSAGLQDSPRGTTPNTRSLEKEIRILRREVSVLSDSCRSMMQLIVYLGGCTADEMHHFLLEHSSAATPDTFKTHSELHASDAEEVVAEPATPAVSEPSPDVDEAIETSSPEPAVSAETSLVAEAPAEPTVAAEPEMKEAPPANGVSHAEEKEPAAPAATNGATPSVDDSEVAPGEAESDTTLGDESQQDDDEPSLSLSERLRRSLNGPHDAPAEPAPTRRPTSRLPDLGAERVRVRPRPETTDATERRSDPVERIRRTNGRTRPMGSSSSPTSTSNGGSPAKLKIRTKSCGRCGREVPTRSPRCLSCGYRF